MLIRYEIFAETAESRPVNSRIRRMVNSPKTRAGKISQFKHYQTDAPI
jgi:hypothetical protein